MPNDDALLAAFVAAWPRNDFDEYGREPWQVFPVTTGPTALDSLHAALPGPPPPLYQRLVLSYRWPQLDIGICTLLANPAGPDLSGLLAQMQGDQGLWDELAPGGYVPFARAPGGNYDPVCFGTRHRDRSGDCRVVRIDHEQILCNRRVRVVDDPAPSFRALVEATLQRAQAA